MSFGVVVQGLANLNKVLNLRNAKIQKALKTAVKKGAVMIHRDAVMSVQRGPKTGRKYGKHRASAPGEAPASDTGRLASSIVMIEEDAGLSWRILAKTKYALYLEFGTQGRVMDGGRVGRIEPRPFMLPAFEKNKAAIDAMIRKAVAEASRG